jgi:maltose O-acetyltransferase
VRLITATHEVDSAGPRVAGALVGRPIEIGAGSWLGSGACVLPGVKIGAKSIVGAGAIVTKDTDPEGVYVGAPARKIRTIHQG